MQTEAWDANAKLISGLLCGVGPPESKEWRARGEYGDASWLREYLQQQSTEHHKVHYDEAHAKRKLEDATVSELSVRARKANV